MALDIGKKKEKVSDLQGTSSESKQDQKRLSSIKSLSQKFISNKTWKLTKLCEIICSFPEQGTFQML